MGNFSTATVLIIAALVLSAVVGFFVWKNIQENPDTQSLTETPGESTEESLGGQLFEGVETPAGALPDTNPLGADTNPFGDTPVNPFEGLNPFGE